MTAWDWSQPFDVSYRVMRVNRGTGRETGRLDMTVQGGSISRDIDTEIRESAQLTVEGRVDLGTDRLRIYADCQWHDGEEASIALGTFLPNVPKRSVSGEESTSHLELYGLLQEAADDMFETPLTVRKGTNPVDAAASILRGCNLTVAPYDPGSYRLGGNWVFGLRSDKAADNAKGTSKLDAVNDLLALAGYWGVFTDEYGRVVISRYDMPANRSPVWEFAEGRFATFITEMSEERDLRQVANVVKVVYYSDKKEYSAVAVDDDPDSEFSTVSRGRRVCASYEYSDIPDTVKTDADGRKLAADKARELLRTSQSVIYKVTFTHTYTPVTLTDVVDISYPTGMVAGSFAVRSQYIQLTAGIPVECEAQTYQRPTQLFSTADPMELTL